MSSTDARRPRASRSSAARIARTGAVALAVAAAIPLTALSAPTARAETAPVEPTCQDVGADRLGRSDVRRVEIGETGLVLVRDGSNVRVEGARMPVSSLTVVGPDGHESPGWGNGADVRNELYLDGYDHVRICWESPETDLTAVTETTPWTALVPAEEVKPVEVVPFTDVQPPVDERPTTVPTKRSTTPSVTKWSTIVTDVPATVPGKKRATTPTTPTILQDPTASTTTPATNDVLVDAARPAVTGEGAASTTAATPTPGEGARADDAQAVVAPDRLVQTGAETMPLVVASASLVILGGVLLHLSRPSRRRPVRRHGAR
ncbi:hypothetical protein ACFVQ3_02635 [Oerskovia sp. NPDC057915]|uniref:hypothetical protein n=1 Tax=Oerskovia sp. NPDC057915 TaxID=3346280 RepID=UPI0036DBC2B2